MTRAVRLSDAANRDLARLAAFLQPDSPAAAVRARAALEIALNSLAKFPDRGREGRGGLRELKAAFGRDGYVIRYSVGPHIVLVTRIFHARERR